MTSSVVYCHRVGARQHSRKLEKRFARRPNQSPLRSPLPDIGLLGGGISVAFAAKLLTNTTPDILWMSRAEYHILLFYHPSPEPKLVTPLRLPFEFPPQIPLPFHPYPDSRPATLRIQRPFIVQVCGLLWIVRKSRSPISNHTLPATVRHSPNPSLAISWRPVPANLDLISSSHPQLPQTGSSG